MALLPLPALLLLVLPALVRARAARLFGPPALILCFWIADLLMLAEAAGWWSGTFAAGRLLALDVALALVGLIGGRILPSFTLNALRRAGHPAELRPLPGVDKAGVLSLLAVAAVDLAAPGGVAAGLAAAAAAVFAALRLSRWHGLATLGQPILWVLHLAYAFIALALAAKAAALLLGAGWAAGWVHLQAAGAVALMILAVMTRATLGHTGRDLAAAAPTVAAYVLLALAALIRGFGPAVAPGMAAHGLSAAAWLIAFGLFLKVHAPMLLLPRPDGKPG